MKALLEKRNTLAKEIRRLAELANDKDHTWSAEDQENWTRANADFDAVQAEITAETDRQLRTGRLTEIDELLNAQIPEPRVGLELDQGSPPGGFNEPRPASGLTFRDVRTGRQLRALRNNEPLAPPVGEDSPDLGRALGAVLSGHADELSEAERRGMMGGLDSGGGFLLASPLSRRVLDLARAASVVLRAGAQSLPVDSSELTLAKISDDPEGYWRAEGSPVSASEMALSSITLRPKTLAAIVPVSMELLEDAVNAGQIVSQGLQLAMGAEIDRVALLGKGSGNEPRGIVNASGINTVASVGTPADYSKFGGGVAEILEANFPGKVSELAWILHPRDAATLDGLVSGTEGQPLEPTPWCRELQRFHTTKLPSEAGAGSNESTSIIGAFADVVLGMRTSGVVIRVLESGSVKNAAGKEFNAVANLLKLVVAYIRVDVAVLRPSFFTALTGITAA